MMGGTGRGEEVKGSSQEQAHPHVMVMGIYTHGEWCLGWVLCA